MASKDHKSVQQVLVAKLAEVVETQKATIEKQEVELATLRAELEELRREANRNSSNSSRPPSSDKLGDRRSIRRKKKPTGRKRGGQKKHKGHRRELLPQAAVDSIVDVFPQYCEFCQQVPIETVTAKPKVHQVVDLNGHGGRHVTEYRRHCYVCTCGKYLKPSVEAIPVRVFGPRLCSAVASLTGHRHLSRRTVKSLVWELWGIQMALGTISAIEGRMSQALEGASNEAMAEVEQASVKHVDETSWVRDAERCSAWVFASLAATVIRVATNGKRSTLRNLLKVRKGTLVSDRATVFLYWAMRYRQICWSHLLRAFIEFSQRDGPAGPLGAQLVSYAELVFNYWLALQRGQIQRAEFVRCVEAVKGAMKPCLERAVKAEISQVSGSCADMLAHWEAMWTFMKRPGVEPTNNHAERELRGLVMWRKRCFGTQSDRGDRFVERMMTVCLTLRKQGRQVLDFLEAAYTTYLNGTPSPSLITA